MKAIYFGDPGGDIKEERDHIINRIESLTGVRIEIEATDIPPFGRQFDILFFDWGGLSLGNSMLEYFCREVIECAEDNPGRIFIMKSLFTKNAMDDALIEFGDNRPGNIYLTIKDARVAIGVFLD